VSTGLNAAHRFDNFIRNRPTLDSVKRSPCGN